MVTSGHTAVTTASATGHSTNSCTTACDASESESHCLPGPAGETASRSREANPSSRSTCGVSRDCGVVSACLGVPATSTCAFQDRQLRCSRIGHANENSQDGAAERVAKSRCQQASSSVTAAPSTASASAFRAEEPLLTAAAQEPSGGMPTCTATTSSACNGTTIRQDLPMGQRRSAAAGSCNRESSPRKLRGLLSVLLGGGPLYGERRTLKAGWVRVVGFVRRGPRQEGEQKEPPGKHAKGPPPDALRGPAGGGEVTESSTNSHLTFGDWAAGGADAREQPGVAVRSSSKLGHDALDPKGPGSAAGCNGALLSGKRRVILACVSPSRVDADGGVAEGGQEGPGDASPDGGDDADASVSFHVLREGGDDEQAEVASRVPLAEGDGGQAEVASRLPPEEVDGGRAEGARRGAYGEGSGGVMWSQLAKAALEPWETRDYSGDGVLVYVPHVNPSPKPPTAVTAAGSTAGKAAARLVTVQAPVSAPSSPSSPAARMVIPRTNSTGSSRPTMPASAVASPQPVFKRLPDDLWPRLYSGHEKRRDGSVGGTEGNDRCDDGVGGEASAGRTNGGECDGTGEGRRGGMGESAEVRGCRGERGVDIGSGEEGNGGASVGDAGGKQSHIPSMPSPRTAASIIRHARRITVPTMAYERSFLNATHGKG
ncbi:hypothetical protein CLOM_g4165 [Closterium sp. NIES-68]|nr:hypothetical protein CLOM_g4165 [Closterium sp. NIES-68]GJP63664.1 hypothetical protein CLOP_g20728 [Closterium sp. NIES-67]